MHKTKESVKESRFPEQKMRNVIEHPVLGAPGKRRDVLGLGNIPLKFTEFELERHKKITVILQEVENACRSVYMAYSMKTVRNFNRY